MIVSKLDYYIQFHTPNSRAVKLIDCALFDKSTKIGTEVV